ncbi:hypothetical protein [Selenomonas sp. FC4001]|uniref:hypothetical protein n=1 Tax=Selenomonas sp. FC4001 TaxID=1408313 RepID=UPI00055F827E|nr:hypothetical protein [Selenomonas sp. FC4001]
MGFFKKSFFLQTAKTPEDIPVFPSSLHYLQSASHKEQQKAAMTHNVNPLHAMAALYTLYEILVS